MNLAETVTYCSLKQVFLCESIPIKTVYNVFDGRAGFELGARHVFPLGVLAAIT